MKKVLTLAAMVVAILVLASACTGDQGPPGEQGSAGGEGPPGEATRPAGLPDGVQQLTPTIPGMGEHWANPENMPLGPIFGVMNNHVVFVEYMYDEDMLDEVSVSTPEGEATFKELAELSVGAPVDHIDVSFNPEGHEGFEESHWDVHAYFVPHEQHLSYAPGVAGPFIVAGPSVTDSIPEDAVQLTPVIPGMGEHWANPENMPLGPIHGVYQGQLVFREYMYTQDMLEERTVVTPEGEVTFKELVNLSVGAPVDHMDISFEPEGHEGFAEAHWDIHAYSVPHEEHLAYTP